jgi:hypothetical protein
MVLFPFPDHDDGSRDIFNYYSVNEYIQLISFVLHRDKNKLTLSILQLRETDPDLTY